MSTPHESMDTEWWYAVWAAIAAIGVAFTKKINPWPLFQKAAMSLNAPMIEKYFQPMHKDLSYIKAVIDEMPGAQEAKEKAHAKREGWKA